MYACSNCGRDTSGLGKCDMCGEVLCYLCHVERKQENGCACLCPECAEKDQDVEKPRWDATMEEIALSVFGKKEKKSATDGQ
jgi:hypothetical protein